MPTEKREREKNWTLWKERNVARITTIKWEQPGLDSFCFMSVILCSYLRFVGTIKIFKLVAYRVWCSKMLPACLQTNCAGIIWQHLSKDQTTKMTNGQTLNCELSVSEMPRDYSFPLKHVKSCRKRSINQYFLSFLNFCFFVVRSGQ